MATPFGSVLSFRADNNGVETRRGPNDETLIPDWNEGKPGHGEPTLWTHYNNKSRHFDDDLVKDLNNTLDTLMLFAGLFSAAVSAIISQSYSLLRPDTMDILLRETQKPGSTLDETFTPPFYAIRINALLFISLLISMVVALLAILVKQWTRGYQRDLQGLSSPHLLARTRHFRYEGACHWYFSECVSGLSIIMHLSLFMAAVGILDLLQATSQTLAYICMIVPILGAAVLVVTTFIAVVAEDSPYRTPLATGLKRLLRWTQSVRFQPSRPQDGDGPEDELLYQEDAGREENLLVRTKPQLDLAIIVHLLRQADTSTERSILEQCFHKLPQLNVLFRRHPEAILERHDDLFKVYRFLASGCIIEKKNVEEIASGRLERARYLCTFLAWYLSLQRSPKQRGQLQAYFQQWKSYDRLPERLLIDSVPRLTSLIPAARAVGRLDHLLRKDEDTIKCDLCDKMYEDVKTKCGSTAASGRTLEEKRQLMLEVTALLVKSTDCLVFRSNCRHMKDPENTLATGYNHILERLENKDKAYTLSRSEKDDWCSFFIQAKEMANDPAWLENALVILGHTK